jgi:hypothetical protein
MPEPAAPESTTAEDDSADFHLRCIIDSMVRDGASEQEVVRAVHATARSWERPPRQASRRRSLRRESRRLVRFVARRPD